MSVLPVLCGHLRPDDRVRLRVPTLNPGGVPVRVVMVERHPVNMVITFAGENGVRYVRRPRESDYLSQIAIGEHFQVGV
jgi:hypothetical protein